MEMYSTTLIERVNGKSMVMILSKREESRRKNDSKRVQFKSIRPVIGAEKDKRRVFQNINTR